MKNGTEIMKHVKEIKKHTKNIKKYTKNIEKYTKKVDMQNGEKIGPFGRKIPLPPPPKIYNLI